MLRFLAPVLECRAVVDTFRDAAVVERENQLVVHQHIGAARLVLQRLDVGNQFLVVREERRLGIEFAADQRLADEHLARFGRIHRPVMHALFRIDDSRPYSVLRSKAATCAAFFSQCGS